MDPLIKSIRAQRPMIHNITNYVSAADCANITLAIGASPIMADNPAEATEITALCRALVLNTGTLSPSRLQAMLLSGKAANKRQTPVVLDPVGAGTSSFRTKAIRRLLKEIRVSVIRLNGTELLSLYTGAKNTGGVDGTHIPENPAKTAEELAKMTGAIVAVTGAKNWISDGTQIRSVAGGTSMMASITGMGCMLSSFLGAYAAVAPMGLFEAVCIGTETFNQCGKQAAQRSMGTGSFRVNFMDEVSRLGVHECGN